MLAATAMTCTIVPSSPLGRLLIRATPHGLAGLRLLDHDPDFDAADPSLEVNEEAGSLAPLVKKVQQAIAGKVPAWKVPLDVAGPPFLKRVWQALVRVPWGETVSYEELARRAGEVALGRKRFPARLTVANDCEIGLRLCYLPGAEALRRGVS